MNEGASGGEAARRGASGAPRQAGRRRRGVGRAAGGRATSAGVRRRGVRACGREARRQRGVRRRGDSNERNVRERSRGRATGGRFRASIFVALTEADENSGRSMTYFRRSG
jgi:hypothetical protein